MHGRDDEALTASAARIADGAALDWEREKTATPGAAKLERVADVARAWRALGVTPPDDDAGDPALFAWGALEAREKLGEGSFGEVFRAWDPALQRDVALKLRRAGEGGPSARRALDESRRLARVRHRNVVAVYGADEHDGRAGFWCELIHGATLERLLAERGPFGPDEAAHVGLDLCRALAAVHAAGIVHGDVKLANIMREGVPGPGGASGAGRIVLMDFGSAAPTGAGAPTRSGTPLYAAPEVLRGEAPTPRSDLYALGALLFRLATGRSPVDASSLDELRAKLERGERESLRALRPDLPLGFVAAVERALDRDPARRFADAGAMEAALAESLAPGASRPSRSPGRALAIVGAVLVVGAALVWPWLRRPAPVVPAGGLPPAGDAARSDAASAPAPAVSAPTSAPAAGATAALVADATLWRQREGVRERLASGDAVSPGDHLFLDYASGERAWVYVLDEDDAGEVFALFPAAGTDLANPLSAGANHRLPGRRAGVPFDWVVTSAGGRERVLVLVSRTPLRTLDDLVAAIPAASEQREVQYARVPEGALATLRGIGGMAASPEPAPADHESRLDAIARRLSGRDGVWVRSLVLESRPAP